MALVATINGTPVYSDKRASIITDTRVTFTDGSWCDVRTGHVHNIGSGYINVGESDSKVSTANTTEGPKRVTASALDVRSVIADVQVEPHRSNDIEYTITGPADQVKSIRATVQDDILVIESDGPRMSGDNVIVSGGGMIVSGGNVSVISTGRGKRTVVSGGSGVVIGNGVSMSNVFTSGGMTSVVTGGGASSGNAVKITVKVPPKCSVAISGVHGDSVVGDTYGSLVASVQNGSLNAGSISSTQLTVRGDGEISVKQVNGPSMVQIAGSGNVTIHGGEMSSLSASVTGSGDIRIGGSAVTASLAVTGDGGITVAHVQQRPMKSVTGSGRIRIRRTG